MFVGGPMDFCYVDESGDGGELLTETRPASTPLVAIVGVIVPGTSWSDVIWSFLSLKKELNPHLHREQLDKVISCEMKGSDLRSDVRSPSRRRRRRAIRAIDGTMQILERTSCKIIARVHLKNIGEPANERALYTSSIGWLGATFQSYLVERGTEGLLVLDSRNHPKNLPVCHAISTRKFKSGGDQMSRVREVPLFGHSASHTVLQVADIVASALIFPLACSAFGRHLDWNVHSHHGYDELRTEFGARVRHLQYRYSNGAPARWRGGVHVSQPNRNLSSARIFGEPSTRGPGGLLAPSTELFGA